MKYQWLYLRSLLYSTPYLIGNIFFNWKYLMELWVLKF